MDLCSANREKNSDLMGSAVDYSAMLDCSFVPPWRRCRGQRGSLDMMRSVAQRSVVEQDPGAFPDLVGIDENSPETEIDSKCPRKSLPGSQGSD